MTSKSKHPSLSSASAAASAQAHCPGQSDLTERPPEPTNERVGVYLVPKVAPHGGARAWDSDAAPPRRQSGAGAVSASPLSPSQEPSSLDASTHGGPVSDANDGEDHDGEGAVETDLDALFRSHSPYVAGVAIRLLGRDGDVDDLVQDVFLEAHRGIHRLRNPHAVRAWLVKVTVRMARRRLQVRRAKRFLHLDEEPDYGHLAAPGADQEAVSDLRWVYRELDRMGSDERLCWTLRFVESHSLEEVVELTGLSLSTVKRRIAGAKSRLHRAQGER